METKNVNYTACGPGRQDYSGAEDPVIVLPTCKGIFVFPVQQIVRIQSISNYSKLFFKNGKTLVVAKVLRWFQEQPCFFSFVRIHRTHFVNIHCIKSYSGGKSGLLLLHNGEMFSVARRKKADMTRRFNGLNNFFTDASAYTSLFNSPKIMTA